MTRTGSHLLDQITKYQHHLLALIILTYVVLGTFFAIYTPLWQAPDEPAHYNYIRHLAQKGSFPVLRAGDYPHEYLEELKARRFPPEMSIAPLRYESHQPPLYFLLATGVYLPLSHADLALRVIGLRLLSVLFGAMLLYAAWKTVQVICPSRPQIALGAAAFIAFLPMHVSISASINNDALAELLLALVLLRLVCFLKSCSRSGKVSDNQLMLIGILIGLAMLTKSSVYVVVPLSLAGVLGGWWLRKVHGHEPLGLLRTSLLLFLPALLMAAPWWLRNIQLYGGRDFLGLDWHDAIVVNQPRTADWIGQMGLGPYLTGLARTTFQSFWGQFGWMGVLLDSRLYLGLALFSGLVLLGCLTAAPTIRWAWERSHLWQRVSLGLLAFSALMTLAGFLWYNLQFVQHQGRYLFPALIPIALVASCGLYELAGLRGSRYAAGALGLIVFGLALFGLLRGDLPLLWMGVCLITAGAFAIRGWLLDGKWTIILFVMPFAGMGMLSFYSLFGVIVPYFGP